VTHIIIRFSSRERVPFLKVVDIWDQRKVLSGTFLHKLRDLWNASGGDIKRHSLPYKDELVAAPKRALFPVEPKLGDPSEVGSRWVSQMKITSSLLDELELSLPKTSRVYEIVQDSNPVRDPEILKRVLTSLCAELNVCKCANIIAINF